MSEEEKKDSWSKYARSPCCKAFVYFFNDVVAVGTYKTLRKCSRCHNILGEVRKPEYKVAASGQEGEDY